MRLILGIFGLGIWVGMNSDKWLPVLKNQAKKAEPLGKAAVQMGREAADKAKDAFWEKSEKFADVIAEIKDEKDGADEENVTRSAPQYDA